MKKISIQNIKNISSLQFEIPNPGLYVLTGSNGAGKTTLFTCISRICNNNAYRNGFPSKSNDTFDVYSGSICYLANEDSITYSRRENGEWRANKRNSTVLVDFGYPQIINITTKDDRVFFQDIIIPRKRNNGDTWINSKMNSIFDTERFTAMVRITTGDLRHGRSGRAADNRRRNTAYAIPLDDGKYYTEQNFSFGEIVTVNLLHDVKAATNGSLILIDELELALHPAAQIRLMDILKSISQEKGLTIIISTHSASIIKSRKDVILLDRNSDGNVNVIYNCPPAKAIGAIGMREDTNPDIIILVEDSMAKSLYFALQQRYFYLQNRPNYLDIRILEIGGFSNVVNYFIETENYLFYDNVYVAAFMDKDVETDIIPYDQYGNQETIRQYNENSAYLHFLPYTPEVLLVKTFYQWKRELLEKLSTNYSNWQLQYSTPENFDFANYEAGMPDTNDQGSYNNAVENRGAFRKNCKKESKRISEILAQQLNLSIEEIFRFVYSFSVERVTEEELNLRAFLAPTMERQRR